MDAKPSFVITGAKQFGEEYLTLILMHMLRCEEIARKAVARVPVGVFNRPGEQGHMLLWRLGQEFMESNGKLVPKEYLRAKAQQEMLNDPRLFPEEEAQRVLSLIDAIYAVDESAFCPEEIRKDINELLEERIFREQARELLMASPDDMLSQLTQLRSRTVLGDDEYVPISPFKDNQFGTQSPRRLTGVAYIDEVMYGFPPAGVVGLLGATGGGKTLMLTELAARIPINDANARTVLLSYEQPLEGDIFDRIYCAALEVSKDEILGRSYDDLSPNVKKKYEAVKDTIGDRVAAYSMLEDRGLYGVDEVRAAVDTYAQHVGAMPQYVFIDWIIPFALKVMGARGISAQHLRLVLVEVMPQLMQFASEYECVVVVANQLTAEAAAKGPYYKPEWTDAVESKSFAHFLEAVAAIGKRDQNDVCWFNVSKNRGAPMACRAIRMLGAQSRFQLLPDTMTISRAAASFYDPTEGGIR